MAYYYKNNKEINALVDYTVVYYKNSVFLLVIDCSLWFIRHYRVNHILNVTLTFKAYVSVLHYFYVILVSKCSPSKVLCFKAWSLVWYITILNHGFIGHLEGDGGINLVFRTSKICTSYKLFFSWWIFPFQVDMYLLPQAAFPTGGLYFKNKTWVKETKGMHVIIHNNYIVGFEKKIKRFRDYGLWLVDDHAHESPLGTLWWQNFL